MRGGGERKGGKEEKRKEGGRKGRKRERKKELYIFEGFFCDGSRLSEETPKVSS